MLSQARKQAMLARLEASKAKADKAFSLFSAPALVLPYQKRLAIGPFTALIAGRPAIAGRI